MLDRLTTSILMLLGLRMPALFKLDGHDVARIAVVQCNIFMAQAAVCCCAIIMGLGARSTHIATVAKPQSLNQNFDMSRVGFISQTLWGNANYAVENVHLRAVVRITTQTATKVNVEVLEDLSLVFVERDVCAKRRELMSMDYQGDAPGPVLEGAR